MDNNTNNEQFQNTQNINLQNTGAINPNQVNNQSQNINQDIQQDITPVQNTTTAKENTNVNDIPNQQQIHNLYMFNHNIHIQIMMYLKNINQYLCGDILDMKFYLQFL